MSWIYRLLDVIDPHTVDGVKSWHVAARTELPFAVPAAIVACGLVLACMNFLPHIILRFRRRFVLFLLRLLGLAAILVMILQLEAEVTFRRTRPAHVAVVVDTSESMALKDCDGQSRLAAATKLAAAGIGPALRDRARLSWYAANWQLRDGAPAADTRPAGPTDLGRAVTECIERAGAPRAILLLTDGRSAYPRRVADAARIAKQSGVRVYGLCLGKAGPARAVSVHVTEADAYVRLGDELPLAADIRAEGLTGQTVDVFLYEDNDKKPRMQRKIELADRPVKVTFRYRPRKVGRRRYRIAVGAARGAVTDLANVSTTAVDVIDDPIRVLYVEGTPRFELKYLNNWLARDPVVELTTVTRMPKGGWFLQGKRRHKRIDEGFPVTTAELFDYDVLIFGDIPRAVFRQGGDVAETRLAQIASFVVKRGGGLITLGGQSVYGAGLYGGSALEALLPFRIGGIKRKQIPGFFHIQPVPAMLRHPVMALARDVEATREAWFDLPKLDGCNAVGALKPAATLLAFRKEKDKIHPVLATHDVGRGRVLSMTCDTTWRWEMQRRDEVDPYRKFWGRAVRYVAADPRTRPRKPGITAQSSRPVVGTEFPLVTTLLDESYDPVRQADLVVEVAGPSGRPYRIYPSDSGASPGIYRYAVGLPEPGLYAVKATVHGTTTTHDIIAGDAPAEMDNPGATLASLRLLAHETGGAADFADAADRVLAALPLEPERYDDKVTLPLWNLPLLAAVLLLAGCADWWIRKSSGLV